MSTTTKRPLCDKCRHATPGFREDADGNIIGRCECRLEPTAVEGRDAGLAAARQAHPNAFAAALQIITDTAQVMPELSGNQTREAMVIAQVPPQVIGAAFARAAADGILRECGMVRSTDPGTHRHRIANYKSLLFRPGRRTA